jgi:hypothetical protein
MLVNELVVSKNNCLHSWRLYCKLVKKCLAVNPRAFVQELGFERIILKWKESDHSSLRLDSMLHNYTPYNMLGRRKFIINYVFVFSGKEAVPVQSHFFCVEIYHAHFLS